MHISPVRKRKNRIFNNTISSSPKPIHEVKLYQQKNAHEYLPVRFNNQPLNTRRQQTQQYDRLSPLAKQNSNNFSFLKEQRSILSCINYTKGSNETYRDIDKKCSKIRAFVDRLESQGNQQLNAETQRKIIDKLDLCNPEQEMNTQRKRVSTLGSNQKMHTGGDDKMLESLRIIEDIRQNLDIMFYRLQAS